MLELGREPEKLILHLALGAGFTQPMPAEEPATGVPVNYPAGATMTLQILGEDGSTVATWTATISGSTATFSQTAAQVQAVLDAAGDPKHARLYYDESGSEPLLLAEGDVRRHG